MVSEALAAQNRGILLFNSDEGSGTIATALSARWRLGTGNWQLDQPIPALPAEGPIVWIGLATPDLDRRYAELQDAAPGRVAALVGTDIADLRMRTLRWLCLPGPTEKLRDAGGRPWLLVPDEFATFACAGGDVVLGNTASRRKILALSRRNAGHAIVIGHGREDVLTFGSRGLCGQATAGSPSVGCRRNRCSYRFRKESARLLRARVLLLLSCNAGRLGAGLMPPDCRLGFSASHGSDVVLTAVRLFTLSPDLVVKLGEACARGAAAAELANIANWHQLQRHGEQSVFAVFGPPWLRTHETICPPNTQTTGSNLSQTYWAELAEQERAIESLRHLKLATHLIRPVEDSLQLAAQHPGADEHSHVRRSAIHTLLAIAAHELLERTETSPYWISSTYTLRFNGPERADQCPICSSAAVWSSLEHHRHRHLDRTRLTCIRCGVVVDRPVSSYWQELRLSMDTPARLASRRRQTVSLQLQTPARSDQPLWIAIGINGQGRPTLGHGFEVQRAETEVVTLELDLRLVRQGTYFLKCYVLGLLGVAELALPLRIGSPEYPT